MKKLLSAAIISTLVLIGLILGRSNATAQGFPVYIRQACTATSGVPCTISTSCTTSAAVTCTAAASIQVPAGSTCSPSIGGAADTSTGTGTVRATLVGTTLTLTPTMGASQSTTVGIIGLCG